MPRIVKNTLLNYLPAKFDVEHVVNSARVFDFNNNPIEKGAVVYLCEREIRAKDNFALQFALQTSKRLGLSLKVVHPRVVYEFEPKQRFIDRQIEQAMKGFDELGLKLEFCPSDGILDYLSEIGVAVLVIDFNPILDRSYLTGVGFKIFEVDGHNIVPARFVSEVQEYNAASFRRKIYGKIAPFLTEFENVMGVKVEADCVLREFIENKLSDYAEFKNNPVKCVVSGLSVYLNLGFISAQRVALEVVRAEVLDGNKEAFLEELVVRKELADNFCLYCDRFKVLDCCPEWAKRSLKFHGTDVRVREYDLVEFEGARTHDELWNAAQRQLLSEGRIHGYLRMYWAKKVLEWSRTPEQALEIAIYLNDRYGYDSPSCNGYVGILWAIGGLHDRAFRDWFVTGKVRRMMLNSQMRKFDVSEYENRHGG